MWSDDGIVLRLPEAIDELPLDELAIDPDEIDELVVSAAAEHGDVRLAVPGVRGPRPAAAPPPARPAHAAVAAAPEGGRPAVGGGAATRRSRSCSRRRASASTTCSTCRRCARCCATSAARKVRVVAVDTPRASPMAQSLLFGWIAVYMYEGDAPLAERRAAALALDRDLLRDLLGAEELRELLDPDVLADLELELQHLVDGRRARDVDEVHDLAAPARPAHARRARRPQRADGLDVAAAVEQLVARAARLLAIGERPARRRRGRGPPARRPRRRPAASGCRPRSPSRSTARSTTSSPASPAPTGRSPPSRSPAALGLGVDRVLPVLEALEAEGRVVRGEFRPDGVEPRVVRRRRAAPAAAAVAVGAAQGGRAGRGDALARFLPAWQGVGSRRRGLDALVEVLGQLQGAALPASVLEADILPARLGEYRAADLDALCTAGEVVWVGAGGSAPSTAGCGSPSATRPGCSCPAPGDGFDAGPEPRRRSSTTSRSGAPASGPSSCRRSPPPACPTTTPRCSPPCGTSCGPGWSRTTRWRRCAPSCRARASAHRRRSTRRRTTAACRASPASGRRPAPAGGRWSRRCSSRRPTPTEAAHAQASQLLERYGVLTREAALAEGIEGGFAGVYPVLKALEERGPGAAGLLRRRPRRRPVRPARAPSTGCASFRRRSTVDGSPTTPRRRSSCCRPSTPPSPTAPRCGGRSRRAGRRGPPAPTSCSPAGEPVAFLERGGHAVSTFPAHRRPARLARRASVALRRAGPLPQPRDPHRRRHAGAGARRGRRCPAGPRLRRGLQGPRAAPDLMARHVAFLGGLNVGRAPRVDGRPQGALRGARLRRRQHLHQQRQRRRSHVEAEGAGHRAALERRLGFAVPTFVRTAAAVQKLASPFGDVDGRCRRLPQAGAGGGSKKAVAALATAADTLEVDGTELWWHLPKAQMGSKLPRNWGDKPTSSSTPSRRAARGVAAPQDGWRRHPARRHERQLAEVLAVGPDTGVGAHRHVDPGIDRAGGTTQRAPRRRRAPCGASASEIRAPAGDGLDRPRAGR